MKSGILSSCVTAFEDLVSVLGSGLRFWIQDRRLDVSKRGFLVSEFAGIFWVSGFGFRRYILSGFLVSAAYFGLQVQDRRLAWRYSTTRYF